MDALSILIKPASGSCNMHCTYCFYVDVASARVLPNRGIMEVDTLDAIVRKAFEEAEHFVSFGFQGGEPLLAGLDFYQAFIDLQKRYNTQHIETAFSIQTNGSLINEAWAQFFAEFGFLVGLSIDGKKEMHDSLRPSASGEGSFDQCMKAAELLNNAGADFNVLTVLTRQVAEAPDELWQFYHENDFRFVQLIACLDGLEEEHGSNPFSLDDKLYGQFLCRFFDLWYEAFIKDDYISVRAFDNWIQMLMGRPPENCGMAGRCAAYPVIEADGLVYPCDFYVLDHYKIGDVCTDSFETMLSSPSTQEFIEVSVELQDACQECEYHFICRSGCRRDREPIKEGVASLNYYCEGYKMFFAHALPRMQGIAQNIMSNMR